MKLLALLVGLAAAVASQWGSRVITGSSVQHPVQYLRALHSWRRTGHVARRGCPAPEPCTCHCDCQATTFEKPPPPLLPCPTFYPPFPTNPPVQAVAAEPDATTTTAAPTTTSTTTSSTEVQMQACVLGEVQRTDGTCQKITAEVIQEMKALVREKKRLLDLSEAKYNHPLEHKLSSDIMGDSGALLYAHEEYRKALDLLLAMMALYTPPVAVAPDAAAAAAEGPEFVEGQWDGNAHCEAWAVNSTCGTTATECAVVCRHQPFCKGFAINRAAGDMCVWFDYKKPDPAVAPPSCAGPPAALTDFYTKNRNITVTPDILGAMQKVGITSQLLESVLAKSDFTASAANSSLEAWEAETNSSLKDALEVFFLDAKRNYTASLGDAKVVREERRAAVQDALEKIRADADPELSVNGSPLSTTTTTTAATTTPGTTTTTTTLPVVELHWTDFPNSEDSGWALAHPECPMGPPCFCDCKCHGAPPQNFVEPPPPLPQPCPGPPPLPPPSAFSMPMGAPALPLGPSMPR